MPFDHFDLSFLPAWIDPWYVAEALAFIRSSSSTSSWPATTP
ncbi:MAG: hypothetical protein WDN06_23110 [Asticcacaulis sp.]